jgi:tRNA modification GTPase
LSTPAGSGAIGLIRISGEKTLDIVQKIADRSLQNIQPNTAFFCRIMDQGTVVDETIVTFFAGPNSFTGEDTVEISCHGSGFIIRKILSLLTQYGAEMAQAGEFTMRAFLNGKMDLSQAEAVADLIASENAAAHKIAMNQMRGGFSNEIKRLREELIQFASLIELELDFAEEDVEFADRKKLFALINEIDRILETLIASFEYGNAIKNGIPVAIVGAPNAGKSTLLNALLNEEKAIVSSIAGTTRDVIEDTVVIEGIQFRFIDTAGIRSHTSDEIERQGIERSYAKIEQAQIVLYCGSSDPKDHHSTETLEEAHFKALALQERYPDKTVFTVGTKNPLQDSHEKDGVIYVSAKHKHIGKLTSVLVYTVQQKEISHNQVVVTNVRHLNALKKAQQSLAAARTGMQNNQPGDLVAMDIRATLHYLGEITGTISTEDLLGNIFSKFCIGK